MLMEEMRYRPGDFVLHVNFSHVRDMGGCVSWCLFQRLSVTSSASVA